MGVIMPDNRFRYSKDVDSFPSRGLNLIYLGQKHLSYFHEKICFRLHCRIIYFIRFRSEKNLSSYCWFCQERFRNDEVPKCVRNAIVSIVFGRISVVLLIVFVGQMGFGTDLLLII